MADQSSRAPAETFPPGEFIRDEMTARGWTVEHIHDRLGNDPIRCCAFDLVAYVDHRELTIDENTAEDLAMLFGTNPDYWTSLDRAWRLARD